MEVLIEQITIEHILHAIILGSYLLGVLAGILAAAFWFFMRRRKREAR